MVIPLVCFLASCGGGTGAPKGSFGGPANVAPDPSGAFMTALTVAVPSFHGLEPSVALKYDSSLGNGVLGVGWRLQGDSRIQRVSAGKDSPRYDATDRYFLDGAELVVCQAEVASLSRDQQQQRSRGARGDAVCQRRQRPAQT